MSNLPTMKLVLSGPMKGEEKISSYQKMENILEDPKGGKNKTKLSWLRKTGPLACPNWFWLFLFTTSSLIIVTAIYFHTPGDCENMVSGHPSPEIKATLLHACKETQKHEVDKECLVVYCNQAAHHNLTMKTPTSAKHACAWIRRCTYFAKNIFEEGKKLNATHNCTKALFYDVSHLSDVMFPTEGAGSRRRRGLININFPGQNKWLQLAGVTANLTGVQTPCWVCSFKPHHSRESPTSVPVPVTTSEALCIMYLSKIRTSSSSPLTDSKW